MDYSFLQYKSSRNYREPSIISCDKNNILCNLAQITDISSQILH